MRQGIYLYSESEINKSSGIETERRWWNEKAKELSEDSRYDKLNGDEMDKKLHEEWRLHKAGQMVDEEVKIREALENILEKRESQGVFGIEKQDKEGNSNAKRDACKDG